ncbi:MAG: tetratricopeptide repeat protein [Candidatus Lambdaproteobacteria bacterium]|nr:tetratricopeptide repeat protein [Candidatus Lambdaproteobacteria bacterium]
MLRRACWFCLGLALWLPPSVQGQRPMEQAALGPVAVIGQISEGEKAVLYTGLQAALTDHYRLIPQSDYRQAEERAFRELDAARCTEEACVRKIQELLQVERLILLQVVREQSLTQLSLTMFRGEQRLVRADPCVNCSIAELAERIGKLAGALVATDLGQRNEPATAAAALRSPQPAGSAPVIVPAAPPQATPDRQAGAEPTPVAAAPPPSPIAAAQEQYEQGRRLYDSTTGRQREPQRSIAHFSEAIRLDPKYVSAYVQRGNVYRLEKDYGRAMADFDIAIELDPNSSAAYSARGIVHRATGHPIWAIADYDKAIQLDPKNAAAFNNRGLAYVAVNLEELAIRDYDEAIRLRPNNALAYNNRGSAYQKLGQRGRAYQDWRKACELGRKDRCEWLRKNPE